MPYPDYICDPNAVGQYDFTTLDNADAVLEAEFVGDQNVTVQCRAGEDMGTVALDFTGWSTPPNASATVTIKAEAGSEHNGVLNAGFIRTIDLPNAIAININLPYFGLNGIQVNSGIGTARSLGTIVHSPDNNVSGQEIRDLITVANSTTTTPSSYHFRRMRYAENILCVNIGAGTTGVHASQPEGTINVTFLDQNPGTDSYNRKGFLLVSASLLKNCVSVDSFKDYDGSSSVDPENCASTDLTAFGPGAVTGVVSTDGIDFVSPSTFDYHPQPLGKLDGAGTSPPVIPLDIEGYTRNDPDDIGSYAIVGAAQGAELTLPTVVEAETSALIGCTTDTAGGTLYWYVSTSATAPSAADLKAGTGAVSSGSFTPTLGANTVNATGLTASTNYWHYWIQETT